MTVIVAGQGRKSGKTTAVCDVIAATKRASWTAIKVTAHTHGSDISEPVVMQEREPGTITDTGRYLAAGARRSVWVRCRPADILRAVTPFLDGNAIVESNSAAVVLPADLIVFIQGESDESKPSAVTAAGAAHVHVERIDGEVITRIQSLVIEQ